MNINFRKIARGPAWERWLIVEDQLGDTAFAGEIVITYADVSGYADVECDILFSRDLNDMEAEELLKAVINLLSGQGNVTLFTAHQMICKDFSLLDEEDEGFDDEDVE